MAQNEPHAQFELFPGRRFVKALVAAGGVSLAVIACIQSTSWVFTTLRTRMLTTVALASMSAMVTAQAPAGGAPVQASVNPQIVKVADSYTRTMLAGDAKALAAVFAADGYELPPHLPAVKGRAAIQQRYETFFKGPVRMTAFRLAHIESTIEGDVAYDVGTSEQRLLLPDGKTVSDAGKYIAILKRTHGKWKLAYLAYNSNQQSMPCSSGQ